MSVTAKQKNTTRRRTATPPWSAAWDWLARPAHHAAVRRFRTAAASGDARLLESLLDPGVAVVIDSGEREHRSTAVVKGARDATTLLVHGMTQSGLAIVERAVNGQAGLIVSRGEEATAVMTVDFSGPLISAVWVRLHPEILRSGNTV